MTNYEKTKHIIRALLGQKLTGCELKVCLYFVDELYGHTGHKQVESSSYQHIAMITGFKRRQIVYSIKLLESKHIIQKQLYATKYGNSYAFIKPDLWLK